MTQDRVTVLDLYEYKHLVGEIACRLHGIHYDRLTTAERQIVDLLIKADVMGKDSQGNVIERVDN